MRLVHSLQFASLVVGLSASCARQAAMEDHSGHDMSAMGASSAVSVRTLPPSGSQAAARLAASPRRAEWVRVPFEPGSSDTVMAWVSYPAKSNAKTPVVVVIHENTCLVTWNRGVADQLAADGFIAIAPDLCSKVRSGPSDVELARDSVQKILPSVTPAMRNAEIAAVAKWGMSLPDAAPRYAVIGFCWGGGTVWMHAVNGGIDGYSGGVAFYGTAYFSGPTPIADSLARINKPLMLLNGSRDARISAAMPAIDSMMKSMQKDYSSMNYQDAIHGFLRAQGDTSVRRDTVAEKGNVAATADAWPRTLGFLRKNLGVK